MIGYHAADRSRSSYDSDDDVIVIDSDNEAVRSIKKKHRKVVSSNNWLSDSMFECKETDVAKRLTTILAESEKNNVLTSSQDSDDDSNDASKMPSRFGSNIHRPELENVPSLIQINETAPPGTLLFKVGLQFFCLFLFLTSHE